MYVHTLDLTNFRNYDRLEFWPSDGLNVLYGANAQGKSGIVEAIYLLATSKSHRTSHDLDMIRIDQQSARVFGEISRSARNDVSLEIIISRSEKKIVKINTVRHPKIGDIVGQLNAVVFSTSDLDMVKGEPSRRRRFLNLEVSQVSPQYVYALGRYKRVLEQRNNLLKDIKTGTGTASGLEIWDTQLSAYGASVISKRSEFIKTLARSASDIYTSLTQQQEELKVEYKSSLEFELTDTEQRIGERFLATLNRRRQLDMSRATTTVGPHRDDMILSIDGLPAREFASQGQQRTIAIALKLAEIELIENSVGESPVVLLDDVMAELDEVRRSNILNLTAGKCQTIITTAHLEELDKDLIRECSIFEVKSGRVMPR